MARTSMMKAASAANPAPKVPDWSWKTEDELAGTRPSVAEDGKLSLPGFGRPVNEVLEQKDWGHRYPPTAKMINRCPNALQEWGPEPITVREKNMMQVVNSITDKAEWRRKVFDEGIIANWRAEAITEEGQGFTEKMFDHCIAELQHKANQNEESGLTAVLDSEWAVVKSDTIISAELKQELQDAVKSLEDVPDEKKDWHPGSNNQVLDLVHPSLFPLIYGQSRVLSTGTTTLEDCVQMTGKGEIVPEPSQDECRLGQKSHWRSQQGTGTTEYWSNRFQWLPSDVFFTENDSVKIKSYINNLHPIHHRTIYLVIEKFVAKSIPAWDLVLSSYNMRLEVNDLRIPFHRTEYIWPLGECPPPDVGSEFEETSDEWSEAHAQWINDNRILIKPDARDFTTSTKNNAVCPLNLRNHFANSGLQVIVKLATIHLSPSSPSYTGGSWHIEGKLNEHIAATSLYYYSSHNITSSALAFRTKVSTDGITERDYAQDDNEGVCYLFDVERDGPGVQSIGKVETGEGRLLAFPNVLQHQVQPFELEDPTQPGHRKILALFLVDPFQRVISTANVPPQQKEWWAEAVQGLEGKLDVLPPELRHQVLTDVGDFPISLEEAKVVREELMNERRAFVKDVNVMYASDEFSFCEH
ncbi:hypothetical protein E4T47_02222 [Aureobasidium subglaciale]|nr:hypothetical protein E4T47_02222 [Aureobasidium subglaciale]